MANLRDLIVNGSARVLGTLYATTPAKGDNSTKVATTAFVTTALAAKANTSHNQASSTITALTGYKKATASAAICASDSLNTALGKLEYKCENATVSKILVGMIP